MELRGASAPVHRHREPHEGCNRASKADDRQMHTTQTDWEKSRSMLRTV